ncbi:hypothetical protein ACSG4H_003924 [Cronobacter turicensis]|nr:type II toxin-antitoxin system RelE/ParE family toxin [Cronobacter turicensis]
MAEYRLTDEAQRDLKQIKKFTEIRFGARHTRDYLLKIRRARASDGRAKRDRGGLPAAPFSLRQPCFLLHRA